MKLTDQFPTFPAFNKPVANGLIPEGAGLPPYGGDLNTQHKTVSGNNWLEELAGLPGSILPRVASFGGINDVINTQIDLSNAVTAEFIYLCDRSAIGTKNAISQEDSSSDRFGLLWNTDNTIYCLAGNSGNGYGAISGQTQTGKFELKLAFYGAGATNADRLKLYIDDIEQTLTFFLADIPSSLPSFTNKLQIGKEGSIFDNNRLFYVCVMKDGVIQVQYYPTGQGDYEYDVSGNNDHGTWSGTGNRFDYDIEGSLYPLLNGLSMYSNVAKELIRVPYDTNRLPLVSPPVPVGYTIRSEHPASVGNINMFDCLVDFEYGSILQCDTAGEVYADQTDAYGLVFDGIVNKGADGNNLVYGIISQDTVKLSLGSYYLHIQSDESVRLIYLNPSVVSLLSTVPSYVSINTDYRYLIWRNETVNQFVTGGIGTFVIYIQGKSKSITTTKYLIPNTNEMELVVVSSGSNPVTENSSTTSLYTVADNDAGDQVSKIEVNGNYISPYAFTVSTGVYSIIDNPDNANFNRFNATIFNDNARVGSDYDSSHPLRFQIDNLDPRILFGWRNVGYKGMLYAKIYLDANLNLIRILEMLNYFSDHVDAEEFQIMIYCGYEPIIIVDEFGDYLIDGDDYVLIEGL